MADLYHLSSPSSRLGKKTGGNYNRCRPSWITWDFKEGFKGGDEKNAVPLFPMHQYLSAVILELLDKDSQLLDHRSAEVFGNDLVLTCLVSKLVEKVLVRPGASEPGSSEKNRGYETDKKRTLAYGYSKQYRNRN